MRRSKKPNGSSLWAPHQLQTLEQVNIFFKTWRRRDRDHHLDSIVSLRGFTERRRPNTGIIRNAKTQKMIPLSSSWSESITLRAFTSETRTLACVAVSHGAPLRDGRAIESPFLQCFFFKKNWGGGEGGAGIFAPQWKKIPVRRVQRSFFFLGRNVPKSSHVEEFSFWNRHI
jgi:hypothetical protein